jgi:hypothetical protein
VNHALGVRSISVRRQLEYTTATVIAEGIAHAAATGVRLPYRFPAASGTR